MSAKNILKTLFPSGVKLTEIAKAQRMSLKKSRPKRRPRGSRKAATTMKPLVRTGLPTRKAAVALGHTYRCHGTELMFSGLDVNAFAVGNKVYGNLVAPLTIGGRLAKLSSLFEKYRINSLSFELTCTGATTSAAALIMAFDADAGDPDPTAASIMRSWNHNLVVESNTGGSNVLIVKVTQPDSGYYTSFDPAGDYRLSFCGQIYTYLLNKTVGASVQLMLSVHYDITFYEPQLDNPPANPSNFNGFRYNSGFSNMFTSVVSRPSTALQRGLSNSLGTDVWKPAGWASFGVQSLIKDIVEYYTYSDYNGVLKLLKSGVYNIILNYVPHDATGAAVGFDAGTVIGSGYNAAATVLLETLRKPAVITAGGNASAVLCDRVYVAPGSQGWYYPKYDGAYVAGFTPDLNLSIDADVA